MGSAELARLCAVTGVERDIVAALGEFGDEQYALLRKAFEAARDNRERELDRSIDGGLTLVPALIRPLVKRILFS